MNIKEIYNKYKGYEAIDGRNSAVRFGVVCSYYRNEKIIIKVIGGCAGWMFSPTTNNRNDYFVDSVYKYGYWLIDPKQIIGYKSFKFGK